MDMSDKYILDETGKPVPEPDLMKWAKWIEQRDVRRVADEHLVIDGEDVRVSTMFLGLDMSFGEGPPVLWESMVFGGKMDQEQDRCTGNREQAEAMHVRMVARTLQRFN